MVKIADTHKARIYAAVAKAEIIAIAKELPNLTENEAFTLLWELSQYLSTVEEFRAK